MPQSPASCQSPPASKTKHRGSMSVALVCAVVGFLLASQLQSVWANTQTDAANASRLETLQELYNQQMDKSEGLQKQLEQTQEELALYRKQASEGSAQGEALKA